jgi:hypothetical protein
MMVVGLGNPAGTANLHRFGVWGLRELLVSLARMMMEKVWWLCELGILENEFDQTADIAGIKPTEIWAKEAELPKQAW